MRYARPRKPTMRRIVLRRYAAWSPRPDLRLRLIGRAAHAAPFGLRRIAGHETGIRRTRKCTKSRLSVFSLPRSCRFVSRRSRVFVSRRICGRPKAETTRRSTAKVVRLVWPSADDCVALDLQAVRRRGVSRGGAAPQSDGLSWSRVSASPLLP